MCEGSDTADLHCEGITQAALWRMVGAARLEAGKPVGAAGVALGETVVARNPATAQSTRPPIMLPRMGSEERRRLGPRGPTEPFPCGHRLPFSILLSSSCVNNQQGSWPP